MDFRTLAALRNDLLALKRELRAMPEGMSLTGDSRRALVECLEILDELADVLRELSKSGVLPRWVGLVIPPLIHAIVAVARERLEVPDGV